MISSAAEIAAMNGIYAVAILDSSNAVIDVYGTPGVAATAAWDYTDSYASRCTREQEETFAAADWYLNALWCPTCPMRRYCSAAGP